MKILTFVLAVLLSGYATGTQTAPAGDEWQSPQQLSLNKELPHAWFFSFPDVESARKVLPEHSAYWKSLDGEWKFHWAPDPEHRPAVVAIDTLYSMKTDPEADAHLAKAAADPALRACGISSASSFAGSRSALETSSARSEFISAPTAGIAAIESEETMPDICGRKPLAIGSKFIGALAES